jgi:hypothetical protein
MVSKICTLNSLFLPLCQYNQRAFPAMDGENQSSVFSNKKLAKPPQNGRQT